MRIGLEFGEQNFAVNNINCNETGLKLLSLIEDRTIDAIIACNCVELLYDSSIYDLYAGHSPESVIKRQIYGKYNLNRTWLYSEYCLENDAIDVATVLTYHNPNVTIDEIIVVNNRYQKICENHPTLTEEVIKELETLFHYDTKHLHKYAKTPQQLFGIIRHEIYKLMDTNYEEEDIEDIIMRDDILLSNVKASPKSLEKLKGEDAFKTYLKGLTANLDMIDEILKGEKNLTEIEWDIMRDTLQKHRAFNVPPYCKIIDLIKKKAKPYLPNDFEYTYNNIFKIAYIISKPKLREQLERVETIDRHYTIECLRYAEEVSFDVAETLNNPNVDREYLLAEITTKPLTETSPYDIMEEGWLNYIIEIRDDTYPPLPQDYLMCRDLGLTTSYDENINYGSIILPKLMEMLGVN